MLAQKLNAMPGSNYGSPTVSGSTYDGQVMSYVSQWDSSAGFTQGFAALAVEKVAQALRAGLDPAAPTFLPTAATLDLEGV
jgi:hypothetical protein